MKTNKTYKNLFLLAFFFLAIASCKSDNTKDAESSEVETEETSSVENSIEGENSTEKTINPEELVAAKDESKLNPAQLQVQHLLESCVKNNYEAAAKTIMYRGSDQARMQKGDAFNYSNPSEASTVKVTCDVIKQWLGESEDYEFISYQEEETEYGLQHVVEVMFKKQKLGVNRHFFYLVATPQGMLLVNMV